MQIWQYLSIWIENNQFETFCIAFFCKNTIGSIIATGALLHSDNYSIT